jgi:hypothetical protein
MMNSGHFFNACRFVHTGFYTPEYAALTIYLALMFLHGGFRASGKGKIATLRVMTKCSLVPFMGCARRVARPRNSCQSGGQQTDGEAATGVMDEAWCASTAPGAGAGTE